MKIILLLFILTSFLFAQNDYALSFDGGDYVEYESTNDPWRKTDNLGFVSAWIKTGTVSNDPIWSVGDLGSNNYRLFVRFNSSQQLEVLQDNVDATDDRIYTTETVSNTTNYHIVVGTDGSDYLMWIDGVAATLNIGSGSNSGDWLADCHQSFHDAMRIGALSQSTMQYYDGTIDEVAYFNIAPTQAIVDDIYNSGTPKDISGKSGCVDYWRFEEGTGQAVATEISGGTAMHLGATTGSEASDPTWIASIHGWDAGYNIFGFKRFKQFKRFKVFK